MANDIIDINVYETTETVSITVNPNLTTININEVTGVGGSQNLQSVTNFGNTTTNSITANSFIKSGGTGANILLDNGTTTVLANLGTKNDINSKQLQLNYLDRDNSIFDAFYLRTIADSSTFEASNQLLSSLAVLRNISYISQGYTQQINADKFVKLGGAADEYLMADGSISFGGGGGGGATNLAYTASPTNGIVTSNTGTDATLPLADGTNAGLLTAAEKTKISNSVPYTGAVSDVNLGEFGIQLGNLEFDNTPTNIPTAAGSMYYNDTDGTLDLILKGGNVKLQIGQESVVRVVNKTSTNISLLEANYQAVRVTGAQGQRLKVDLAQATTDQLSAETIGLVTETIANNQEGFITTSGLVRNINTTGSLQGETWADGDVLYLSPTVAGRITKVKPIAPNHLVIIGYVIHAHATQGTIFVKVDNGYELDELHNVKIDTATNNEVLAYTSATDIWENKTPSEAGLQPTLVSTTNIKSINGTSLLGSGNLTITATPEALLPYRMLANNSPSTAVPTVQVFKDILEQTYSLSPTFTGTAPTVISSSTYKYTQFGGLVSVRLNLIYTTAGSISQVVIPLPADMPTPLSPTGLSGALDILYYGVGMFSTLSTTVSTVNRVCFLRRNATGSGYEFVLTHSAAISSRVISLTLQYFTE